MAEEFTVAGDEGWVPTTEEVREGFATDDTRFYVGYAGGFDRWLAEIHAEAWDEGYTTGNRHNGRLASNPYREEADCG